MITHLLCPPCSEKNLSDMQLIQCFTSLFLCVPNCLGSKPVSCGVRFISLFIFPLIVSPPYFFPSLSDKQSAFLIRLGKHKTSSWLHFRKGHLRCDKIPFGSGPGLATDNLPASWCYISHTWWHFCYDTDREINCERWIKMLLRNSKQTDKDFPKWWKQGLLLLPQPLC